MAEKQNGSIKQPKLTMQETPGYDIMDYASYIMLMAFEISMAFWIFSKSAHQLSQLRPHSTPWKLLKWSKDRPKYGAWKGKITVRGGLHVLWFTQQEACVHIYICIYTHSKLAAANLENQASVKKKKYLIHHENSNMDLDCCRTANSETTRSGLNMSHLLSDQALKVHERLGLDSND